MTHYRRYISTQAVPTTGIITSKVVAPEVNEAETAHERHARLAYQGSANAALKARGRQEWSEEL